MPPPRQDNLCTLHSRPDELRMAPQNQDNLCSHCVLPLWQSPHCPRRPGDLGTAIPILFLLSIEVSLLFYSTFIYPSLLPASESCASLCLHPLSPIRPPIPALQRSHIAVSTSRVDLARPQAQRGYHGCSSRKWPGYGPRRTRPCARSLPGRVLE